LLLGITAAVDITVVAGIILVAVDSTAVAAEEVLVAIRVAVILVAMEDTGKRG
jgi:hypothetical protein